MTATVVRDTVRDLSEEGPCDWCGWPLYVGDLAYLDQARGRWYCSSSCLASDSRLERCRERADVYAGRLPGVAREPIPTYQATGGPDTGAVTLDVDELPGCSCLAYQLAQLDLDRPAITRPEDAASILVPRLAGLDRERMDVVYLDTKHRVLGVETETVGSVDHTFMAPREVFRGALLAGASAVMLAHNHPSGDPEPSSDDRAVTRRLVAAGELVGVTVLDHFVIGGDRWVSLARRGEL